jgi:uncharacterized membrane-anchored protein
MKKSQSLIIWIALIFLTILVALVSNMLRGLQYVTIVILGISLLKFIAVAFYFMELKKAHIFWKASILIYVFLFSIITLIFLN